MWCLCLLQAVETKHPLKLQYITALEAREMDMIFFSRTFHREQQSASGGEASWCPVDDHYCPATPCPCKPHTPENKSSSGGLPVVPERARGRTRLCPEKPSQTRKPTLMCKYEGKVKICGLDSKCTGRVLYESSSFLKLLPSYSMPGNIKPCTGIPEQWVAVNCTFFVVPATRNPSRCKMATRLHKWRQGCRKCHDAVWEPQRLS